MATTVTMKGSLGTCSLHECLKFLEENRDGEGTMIVKTSQEPAIELLIKQLVEHRGQERTMLRNRLNRAREI